MPPTDKALAVMTLLTEKHLDYLREARNAFHGIDVSGDECGLPSCVHLRDIESLVRYLVAHPERLAGEDEVVVKREELQKSFEMLRDMPSSRYGNAVVTLILSWMKGWLAGSPTAQESK